MNSRAGYADNDATLKMICDSREDAEELVKMIEQAKWRYMIAMANVYNEDGSRRL